MPPSSPHPVPTSVDGPAQPTVATTAAIALMIAAVALFALLDATGKHLAQELPVLQVVWMRFVSHTLLAFVILRLWRDTWRLKTQRPLLQLGRGLMMVGTTILNFWALLYLQLDETVTIMFAGPMLVAGVAGPLMGEWVGPRRWAAILVGFLGVLVVTRPGFDGLGWPALISVGATLCFALYALSTRVLAQSENADGLIMLTGLIPTVGLAPIALTVWVWPTDLATWGFMFLTGVFGGFGHWLLIKAHTHAPAPILAPFIYTQIVWMVALGWLVFGDVPTLWTAIGASITIASGLYLLYREERVRRAAKKAREANLTEIPS